MAETQISLVLAVPTAPAAADWYQHALGATEYGGSAAS
jgi:hypothetical protein